LPDDEAERGRASLEGFIFSTLQQLQKLENQQMRNVPVDLFMRMDIGIIENKEEQTYDFFVNELSRATSDTWFEHEAGTVADQALLTFGLALRRYAFYLHSTGAL
jgi:hypothetical protein